MGHVFARFFSVHFLAGALILALAGREACAQQQAPKPIEIKDRGGAPVALYAESHALIIGISGYTGGWPNLPGVKRDVKEVESALRRHGFSTTVVMDPDRDGLDKAFRGFINRHGQKADNRLLFYFAGHGHTLTLAYGGEMGYLVPKEAPDPNRDQAGFLDAAMSMQAIEVYARNIQSKHALFVFDSCFSGGIFDAARAIPEVIAEKTGRAVRQFITSGTAEQRVPDESIFRGQFVAALDGEGDMDGDGYVTGAELGQFLETKVTNYSRRAQTPRYGKLRDPLLDKGDFVFVLPRGATAQPALSTAVPLPGPDKETLFWDSIKSSENTTDFEAYLRQFPRGTFALLAQNHIAALKAKREKQAAVPALRTNPLARLDGKWDWQVRFANPTCSDISASQLEIRDGKTTGLLWHPQDSVVILGSVEESGRVAGYGMGSRVSVSFEGQFIGMDGAGKFKVEGGAYCDGTWKASKVKSDPN